MIGLLSIVGSKIGQAVITALAVGLILFFTIQYIQNSTEKKIEQEIKVEQLEQERELRDAVEEAIKEAIESNPDGVGSISLDRLRERQSRQ